MKQTDKTYCELFTPLVRILLSLFLLTVAVSGVWGQPTNGVYYITNNATKNLPNPTDKWYLWPSVTINASTGNPYVTTFYAPSAPALDKDASGNTDHVEYEAHDESYSHWVVKNVVGVDGAFQIINPKLGRYIVKRDKADGGMDVWLMENPTGDDLTRSYFYLYKDDTGPYRITYNKDTNKTFNSAKDDKPYLCSTYDGLTPRNTEYRAGLIQFYADTPLWTFTSNFLATPTISDVNPETNKVTITENNNLPPGYKIRYTFSAEGEPEDPTATTSTVITNGEYEVNVAGTLKVVVERYDIVLTDVATKYIEPYRCATPVISYSTETGEVTLSTVTEDASIYYTLDGTEPTASSTPYEGVFEIENLTTVRAIAIKTGIMDSEIATTKLVLNPTIILAEDEYPYSGSAITPTVNVMDGETPINTNEYTVSYKDNTSVGTATIKITDKEGGSYIVYGSTTFTIVPAGVTLTANSGTETYDGTEKTVTGFTSSVDGLTFEGVSASGSGTNAGSYDVILTGVTVNTTKDTSGNYVVTGTTNGTLTINKKALTVTANPKTIIYGNGPTNNGVTYSGFASGEDKSVLSGTLAYTYNYEQYGDVGNTYTITPGGLTGSNYNISFVAGTLTVNPREVGLTWSETTSFVYDGEEHVPTATATGLVNGDAVTVTVTGKQTSAGNYTATASSLTGEKAGNYKLPDANTQEFSITKVVLTVTANDNTITYGDAPSGNGVTYEGFVEGDDESKLGGTLDYIYNYTQFGDVGTYTITPKDLTSNNYDISFVAGTLTVGQKEVGISWSTTTTFPYDGSAHAPTATATGLVNSDAITVTVTGAQTNAGNYTATASALTGVKAGNYKLPAANTRSFTISRKSLGEGTLAEGYILDFGEGNTILLTDDAIGSALAIGTDYSVSDDSDPSDKYSKRTVIGIGNYTGTFDVRNVVISFTTDTEQEEWSATFAAEDTEGFNLELGLALPEGVSAFIISDIRGDWAIPEPLNYIPKGVPVLLVAHKPIYGFVPTKAENGDVTPIPITDDQEDRNMLEEVTEATLGYDPVTESAPFETKQIYVLFKNEFVFNKAGTMKKGKVYLNPNHTDPAPARLLIAWNYTTGIKDGRWKKEDGRSERWYTLDGRRLSGKPTAKGVYIVGGKKIVVK